MQAATANAANIDNQFL